MIKGLIILFVFLSIKAIGQTDAELNKQEYRLVDKEHFYQYCKNCDSEIGRPKMLCGHNYNLYSGGYSYSGAHWLDVGYSKDIASCFPKKGGHLFTAAIITKIDRDLVNGLKISYLRDNLFGLQFYHFKFGFNIEGYTNYQSTALNLRPEIRIADNMDYSGLLNRINFAYGYNIGLKGESTLRPEKHQISIIFILRRKGWIS